MSKTLADRLQDCYSGAVYDVLRARGYPDQVLPYDIQPLERDTKLAGRVYTVSGRVDKTKSAHETLMSWTGLLSKAPSGTVVVCQPNDATMAHMGELSAETLKFRGVRGYVVDGGCRDTAFIRSIGFPVFYRYTTPVDIVGRWVADTYGEPVTLGAVTVRTDDWIIADQDGVVVIPGEIAEEIVEETEAVLRTESEIRKAILQGLDPQDAYLEHGKF